jgi:hypothetical protein
MAASAARRQSRQSPSTHNKIAGNHFTVSAGAYGPRKAICLASSKP